MATWARTPRPGIARLEDAPPRPSPQIQEPLAGPAAPQKGREDADLSPISPDGHQLAGAVIEGCDDRPAILTALGDLYPYQPSHRRNVRQFLIDHGRLVDAVGVRDCSGPESRQCAPAPAAGPARAFGAGRSVAATGS